MNIIVVDDLTPIALTYKSLLLSAGFEVEMFTKPLEASEFLKTTSETFDLIITDVYMDEMNGVELLEEAKKTMPKIKTLCITGGGGYDQNVDLIEQARQKADYLTFKPIHSAQLIKLAKDLTGFKEQEVASDTSTAA